MLQHPEYLLILSEQRGFNRIERLRIGKLKLPKWKKYQQIFNNQFYLLKNQFNLIPLL